MKAFANFLYTIILCGIAFSLGQAVGRASIAADAGQPLHAMKQVTGDAGTQIEGDQ
jgi:hypothetical protein